MTMFPACDMFHDVKVIRPRSGERQGRRQGDFWPAWPEVHRVWGNPNKHFRGAKMASVYTLALLAVYRLPFGVWRLAFGGNLKRRVL